MPAPIEVTLSEMTMLVREVHPENAKRPIEVMLSGMTMLVREVHPANAEFAIAVTLTPPIVSGTAMLVSDPVYPVIVADSTPSMLLTPYSKPS